MLCNLLDNITIKPLNSYDAKKSKNIQETFLNDFNKSSHNRQAKIIKEYLIKYQYTHSIITRVLHTLTYEVMNNENLSNSLIINNTHLKMIEILRIYNHKWLMYSCFWNIFRYQSCRNRIKISFIKKIMDDGHIILEDIGTCKVKNTYIGCLSNLSLKNDVKKYISDKLILYKDNISLKTKDTINNTSGLIANLCVSDEIAIKITKSSIFKYLCISVKDFLLSNKDKEFPTLIRNFSAVIINICHLKDTLHHFIDIDLYDVIYPFWNKLNIPIIASIKEHFNVSEFNETSSFHLANKYGYHDLMLKKIKNNEDINKQDLSGNTVLHHTIISGQFNLCSFYILCGADYNIQNNENKTVVNLYDDFYENSQKYDVINKALSLKKVVDRNFMKHIRCVFEHNCDNFEKYLVNTLYEFHNNYDYFYGLYFN